MKITDVRLEMFKWARERPITNGLYTYTHNLLNIVVVDTDEGVTGIGLTGAVEVSPDIGAAIVAHFRKALIGLDPLDNERIWHEMWRPKLVGRRGITTRVLGGIDIALWDIKGKAAGMPLYKLLGGFTDRVDTYIAGGYYEEGKGLEELAAEMRQNVALGARAVKIKVGALRINEDIERVRVCREAIGPDVRLMVDANNAYRHYQAIEFARKAEPYDLFWFEEPVEPDDYRGQREITRATSIPVAAGENEYTRYGFRDLIEHRAVDILQPDALVMGGITEFMKVAALAQAHDLDIAPHGAQQVHIHLVAAIPNGLILEYYRDTVDPMHGKIWQHELEIEDGYVKAPDRPGLGLEPRWETLEPYRV
ncbi:MAG: mandelate racemase/muconate lactonizing enzyme family protein [Gammaproteobacteria bacterium]|nr:mandelate racemase/muconate lactonizing enzyme family protein [Gammaproteobacteria bacterium]